MNNSAPFMRPANIHRTLDQAQQQLHLAYMAEYRRLEIDGDNAAATVPPQNRLAINYYRRALNKRIDTIRFLRGFGIEPDYGHTQAIFFLERKIRACGGSV